MSSGSNGKTNSGPTTADDHQLINLLATMSQQQAGKSSNGKSASSTAPGSPTDSTSHNSNGSKSKSTTSQTNGLKSEGTSSSQSALPSLRNLLTSETSNTTGHGKGVSKNETNPSAVAAASSSSLNHHVDLIDNSTRASSIDEYREEDAEAEDDDELDNGHSSTSNIGNGNAGSSTGGGGGGGGNGRKKKNSTGGGRSAKKENKETNGESGEGEEGGTGEKKEESNRVRKDNHKEVERRRRETINEGINELKKIVPGCEKNKGSILNKAVEYIQQLKNAEAVQIEKWALEKLLNDQAMLDLKKENEALVRQNKELKAQLLGQGIAGGEKRGMEGIESSDANKRQRLDEMQ